MESAKNEVHRRRRPNQRLGEAPAVFEDERLDEDVLQYERRVFHVEVLLNDRSLGTGRGSSKKIAEEAAARVALTNPSLF